MEKVSQVDDVRKKRRDERPETMLADRDRTAVDEERENIRRFETGEPAAEERFHGNGLAVEKTLTQKWLGKDEPADSKKEKNTAVAVIDEGADAVLVLGRKYLIGVVVGLSENVN